MLDAQLEKINDPKRSFAFTVQLRGVPEPLCFGTEDEQIMNDWITRLANASVAKGTRVHTCIYTCTLYMTCVYTCLTKCTSVMLTTQHVHSYTHKYKAYMCI